MRIVIASQTYDPKVSGQGVFTVSLAEGLVQAGHQVMVITPSNHWRAYRTEKKGVSIQAIPAIPLLPLYSDVYITPFPGPQVKQLIDRFQPDIVHLQDHYPLCKGVLRAIRHGGIPVIGSNHFLPENIIPYVTLISNFQIGRNFLEHILWKMALKVLNSLDLITTPSKTAADILRQQKVRPPVVAISCGVDLDRFHPDPNLDRIAFRQWYHLDPQRKLILYVGRVDREKRLDILIKALYRLERQDLQLAIAGKGRQSRDLKKLVAQLNLEDSVVFTGFVPTADLPGLLNSADLFAMPSEAELQSIATLEAMGTGLPILASDARALPELVVDGVNGYLFRSGDVAAAAACLARLADQPDRWPQMGAASLSRVQSHTLTKTINHYEGIYKSLAASPQAVPGAIQEGTSL